MSRLFRLYRISPALPRLDVFRQASKLQFSGLVLRILKKHLLNRWSEIIFGL